MIKYLLTAFMLFYFLFSSSQISDYFDEFKMELNEEKRDDLIKIVNNILEAQKIEKEAEKFISSGDTSKSLNLYKKASDIYSENYRSLYLSFESK